MASSSRFENPRWTALLQAFMPADFGHATFGREISFQNDEASGFLQRLFQRRDHFLSGSFDRRSSLSRLQRKSGHGFRRGVKMISAQQAPGQQAHAAGAMHIGGHKTSGGFQIGEQRSALADGLKIVDLQIDFGFARDSQQMQHGVGRSAGRGHGCDRIFKRIASENIARANSLLQQIQHDFAAIESDLILLRHPSRARC